MKKQLALVAIASLLSSYAFGYYNLTIHNQTAAQTVYLMADGQKVASFAPHSPKPVPVQLDWGTVYNIQYDTTSGGSQILGSLKRDSYYYVLQATETAAVPAWQHFYVQITKPVKGNYGTYVNDSFDKNICNSDGGTGAGITCQLQAVSAGEPDVDLTITGGTMPHQTANLTINNTSTRAIDVKYTIPPEQDVDDVIAPNSKKAYTLDNVLTYTISHKFATSAERTIGILTREAQAGGLDAYKLAGSAATATSLAWMGVNYQITPAATTGGYFTDRSTDVSGSCTGSPASCELGAQTDYVINITDDPKAPALNYTYDAQPIDWNAATTYTHQNGKCPRVRYQGNYFVGCGWAQGTVPGTQYGPWQSYDPYFNPCGNCN